VHTHCCDCGEFVVDDEFKESRSRELTEKVSSQEKVSKEKDTKENANANASTAANPNVDGRVNPGSMSASSSRPSSSRGGKGKDRRETVILLVMSPSTVATLVTEGQKQG